MKNNTLSYFAILISLIAIGFAIFRVTPMVEFENDIYIGIIATFIGILVTLLVGYQIYNAVEIRNEVKYSRNVADEAKAKSNELDEKLKFHSTAMEETFNIFAAKQMYAENRRSNGFTASMYILKSIICSMQLNKTEYSEQFNLLREYIESIDILNFVEGHREENGSVVIGTDRVDGEKKNVIDIISRYEEKIKRVTVEIKENPNFFIIKYEYDNVIALFGAQMEKIKSEYSKT